jgi:hypothetical protein
LFRFNTWTHKEYWKHCVSKIDAWTDIEWSEWYWRCAWLHFIDSLLHHRWRNWSIDMNNAPLIAWCHLWSWRRPRMRGCFKIPRIDFSLYIELYCERYWSIHEWRWDIGGGPYNRQSLSLFTYYWVSIITKEVAKMELRYLR